MSSSSTDPYSLFREKFFTLVAPAAWSACAEFLSTISGG